MGLVICPKCGYNIFDTDIECIYCGWTKKEEKPIAISEQKKLEISALDNVIRDRIEDLKESKADKQNSGYHMLNGVKFDFDAIVQEHSPNHKIAIIKDVRLITGCDLRTAKEFVDREVPRSQNYKSTNTSSFKTPKVYRENTARSNEEANNLPEPNYNDHKEYLYALLKKHGPNKPRYILMEFVYKTGIPGYQAEKMLDRAVKEMFNGSL